MSSERMEGKRWATFRFIHPNWNERTTSKVVSDFSFKKLNALLEVC